MNESRQKVLLYSDNTYQAFSAAVYTAHYLDNNPNTHLTILQVKDKDLGSMGVKYNWRELRIKYKRNYSVCLTEPPSWKDAWPLYPDSKWLKSIFAESDSEIQKKQYAKLLAKTDSIFSERQNVQLLTLYLNISIDEKSDRAEKVETIVDYATKNLYDLIIIGTRGFSPFKRVILGSLSYELLEKSPIPVLLIKKLSQNFIENYISNFDALGLG